MIAVWSHVWGVWWWRLTGASMDVGQLRTNVIRLPVIDASVRSIVRAGVQDLRRRGIEQGIPSQLLTEILTANTHAPRRSKDYRVHVWHGFVPSGSLCNAGDGNYACAPEFCLLLIADDIRRIVQERLEPWQYLVILVELACELCGGYSKLNTPRGFKQRNTPLMSTGVLAGFVRRVANETGGATLAKAIPWVLDNLWSPMETALYLILCLPVHYGGMAIPQPFANRSLPVPKALWNKTARRHIIPDLYWPEANLIVELDSEENHAGREKEDRERVELAQDMGYVVVTFRKADMYDAKKFRAKAESVARHLGHTLPRLSERFVRLHAMLRDMLLEHERWI